jgi:K(+)-stimulated pyrophosphate-energized sodium pump
MRTNTAGASVMDWLLLIATLSGLLSLGIAIYLYHFVSNKDAGTPTMKEIASAIEEGAKTYLRRQNITLAFFVIGMAALLGILYTFTYSNSLNGLSVAISYILGSVFTSIAANVGMIAAVKANVRTTQAARTDLKNAFSIAFYGGAVMGFFTVGMALLGVSVLFFVFNGIFQDYRITLDIILGFSFGASALALFAKAGGGIFTKTADIAADLVGKVELGIPEDDPRNPAVIADNVGDNVGDVAGMGADLIDSYIAGIIAAMIIGASIAVETGQIILVFLPLVIEALGVVASFIGLFFVRVRQGENPGAALNRGTFSTAIIFGILMLGVTQLLDLGEIGFGIFLTATAGMVAGVIIGLTTDFFTSIDRPPVIRTAEVSQTGAATNILNGFSYGLISIAPPILGIIAATLVSWNIALVFGYDPFYSISIAAVGMLATLGMIISADAYGPIVDNARGIAEQSHLGHEVIEIADKLDAAGNTAKAITKGFAIGAAALQVIALFHAFTIVADINLVEMSLMNPYIVSGVFLGAMMPPILSALLILAVGKNSFRMIEEVRRQFREIPGLVEGRAKPDYAKCVDISTRGALRELLVPCLLAVATPLITGLILGKAALAGFLAGSIFTGIIFGLFMANSGGMWDNAKKYIEAGAYGGIGSEAHKAAVTGDTVGDPFKDTAGPSLNTMITVMSLVATIFAPVILVFM